MPGFLRDFFAVSVAVNGRNRLVRGVNRAMKRIVASVFVCAVFLVVVCSATCPFTVRDAADATIQGWDSSSL